jgi:hypothetical protein
MKTKTLEQHKGIIFAGCSFTWGQGLYYYSNLPSLKDASQDSWNGDVVTFSQIEYMKTIRYPRLVANSLKTFEVCQMNNGGSNSGIVEFWNTSFIPTHHTYFNSFSFSHQRYYYKDFQYIIFQITDWTRSPSFLTNPDDDLSGRTCRNDLDSKDFKSLLIFHNITLDEYCDISINTDLIKIKKFLQNFENNGVQALVMTWPNDVVPFIERDSWYNERFITHQYKNKTYNSIQELIENNLQLAIIKDDFFEENPMDEHPSKECHSIIANSVIRKIKGIK